MGPNKARTKETRSHHFPGFHCVVYLLPWFSDLMSGQIIAVCLLGVGPRADILGVHMSGDSLHEFHLLSGPQLGYGSLQWPSIIVPT